MPPRGRGVRFDIGHGCGSFAWSTAAQALAEGLQPDAISTDLHRYSIEHPVVDLPTTMSRFLALGMPLEAVVTATTAGPAAILGRPELGTLRVGGPADITVLEEDATPVDLPDAEGLRRSVSPMLRPVWTIAGGQLHRGRGRRGAPATVPRRRPRGGLQRPDLSGCRSR